MIKNSYLVCPMCKGKLSIVSVRRYRDFETGHWVEEATLICNECRKIKIIHKRVLEE